MGAWMKGHGGSHRCTHQLVALLDDAATEVLHFVVETGDVGDESGNRVLDTVEHIDQPFPGDAGEISNGRTEVREVGDDLLPVERDQCRDGSNTGADQRWNTSERDQRDGADTDEGRGKGADRNGDILDRLWILRGEFC